MYLVVTIDTEEDNWGRYDERSPTLKNIERIPYLQDIFDRYGVKPVYLITYPVARDRRSISILSDILRSGRCEIGSHLHPWNTPPFREERIKRNTMLCNLPANLQFEKMKTLHKAIEESFGITPVIFRAGRWGYSSEVAKNLKRLGYRIDTSITPFMDWRDYHGPDFSNAFPYPYRFCCEDIFKATDGGDLLEVPVTIGFIQRNYNACKQILRILETDLLQRLRLKGIAHRLNLLNLIWLSPELADAKSMARLVERMRNNGGNILNMTFHSSSLKEGLSAFVKTREDEAEFYRRIEGFLAYIKEAGIVPVELSRVPDLL